MATNYELMKLMFDPKAEAILQAVKSKSKTVKEIAIELDEKPSRLYYPIQKLLSTDLIRISEEKQTGNLIEKYFSSTHLFDSDEVLRLEGDLAAKNADFIFPKMLMSFTKGLDMMRADFEEYEKGEHPKKSRAMYTEIDARLTNEEWQQIHQEIRKLINSREDSSGGQEYTFSIMTYETDQDREE